MRVLTSSDAESYLASLIEEKLAGVILLERSAENSFEVTPFASGTTRTVRTWSEVDALLETLDYSEVVFISEMAPVTSESRLRVIPGDGPATREAKRLASEIIKRPTLETLIDLVGLVHSEEQESQRLAQMLLDHLQEEPEVS